MSQQHISYYDSPESAGLADLASTPKESEGLPLSSGWLAMIFFLALLPMAATLFTHHPDEQHYPNAALYMLQHGDWITPHYFSGQMRLNKPILSYWLVAGSFAALGVSVLAARLPFLLAGCGTIWLTHRLTLDLTGKPATARLAALMAMSNAVLITCSMRSMPDILLCFFMLLSAYGLLHMIALDRCTPTTRLAAYGGAALAVATKGLLPALLAVTALSFAAFRFSGVRRREILHWPSALLGLILGGWWFAVVAWRHQSELFRDFGDDQVGDILRARNAFPILLAKYVFSFFLMFLPWSLPALELTIRQRGLWTADRGRPMALARQMILAWCCILAVVFAFADRWTSRYVLPAAPLLAIVLADLLSRADPAFIRQSLSRIGLAALVALAAFGVLAGATAGQIATPGFGALVLVAFTAVVALLALAWRRWGWLTPASVLALVVLATFPLTFLWLSPLRLVSTSEQIVAGLDQMGVRDQPLHYLGRQADVGRLRLAAAGRIDLQPVDRQKPLPPDAERLIAQEADAARLRQAGYTLYPLAAKPENIPLNRKLLEAMVAGRLDELLQRNAKCYYLAVRRAAAKQAAPHEEGHG